MHEMGKTHIQLNDLLLLHGQPLLGSQSASQQRPGPEVLSGLQHLSRRGRSMEFDQSRIYQPGDDVRNIDWRVTARTGKLHSKMFQQERERHVLLLIEQSPALFFASSGNFMSVQAAYLASYFAWLAYDNHDRLGGLIFAENPVSQIKPGRARQSVLRLLYQLGQANQQLRRPDSCQQNPLSTALSHCNKLLRPNSQVVLICAQQHLERQHAPIIIALGKKHDLVLAPIYDPMQYSLPVSKQLIFRQKRNYLSINGRTEIGQLWHRQFHQRQLLWQQLAQQGRASLLPISTQSSVASQLLASGKNRFSA